MKDFSQYTVEDLVYYIGLFGGIIGVHLVTETMEWPRIARLIVGLLVGILAGNLLTMALPKVNLPSDDYDQPVAKKKQDDGDDFDRRAR